MRNFITEAWTAVKPLQNRHVKRMFGNTDGSGDEINQSEGSVSWVLRDGNGILIHKGCKWFSGSVYAKYTDYLELLGFETLIKSIPKKYISFEILVYSDNSGAIDIISIVQGLYNSGLSEFAISAEVARSYKLATSDMVVAAISICVLKVDRKVNMTADGMARYGRGFATDTDES